ncbi:MAG: TonB-dependent siderophore receptor [Cyanobacteria bacterium P01_C01_bin.72]
MRFISPFTTISTSILVTTAAVNFTSPVQAQQLTQITNIDVRETAAGIEIVIKTADGSKPQFVETPDKNILYIDLVDAQLNLASEENLQVENPAEAIKSVTVSEEFAGSVSIVIIGTESLPQVELIPNTEGGIFSVTTSPATAQTPVNSAESESSSEQEIEIIVTGEAAEDDGYSRQETSITGIPQSILDTSLSVQTVPEEVLEDKNIQDLSDISDFVSGINKGVVPSDKAGSSFVIRGFSAVAGRENILRNGLRDDTIRFISGLPNIDKVEVLKGPASVLFGQGTVGGTINLVTKKPLDEPFYEFKLNAGNFDTYGGRIDFSDSLDKNGDLAYRLNLSYEDEGNFRDFQEKEFFFADLTAALIASENTELYFGIEYQKENAEGTAPELPASGTVIDNPLGEIDITANLGEPDLAESESRVTRLSTEFKHKFNDKLQIQSQFLASFQEIPESLGFIGVGLRFDDRTFTRIGSFNETDNRVLTLNTNLIGEFNTGSVKHQLLFGAEYAKQDLEDKLDLIFPGTIDIFEPDNDSDDVDVDFRFPRTDQLTSFDEFGFYIQDQISFSESFTVVLGGRYNIADTEFFDESQPDQASDRVDTDFSPRAGIIYKPANNVSLYGSYTESFLPNAGRSQFFNTETNSTEFGDELVPETGRQYEVGVKAEFGDVIATLALFDIKRENIVDLQTLSSDQIGAQTSRGIELDVAGEILPGWKIIASYAHTDTEISSSDRVILVDEELIDVEGNELVNVPKNAISLWTNYSIQKGNFKGLGFGLGFIYEGEKQGDLDNSFTVPDYFRTDAALFYEKSNFKAQLNVENLFDVRYFESSKDEFRINPGAPFTISGTVTLEL